MAEAKATAKTGAKAATPTPQPIPEPNDTTSTEETPAPGVNKEKLLRQLSPSIEAVAKADGGKELLAKAMSVAHKGINVDEKTLGMIWDEFDMDTEC
eukprot:COSAG01_NODE_27466_length_685_cov_0.795222_2_plen_96_part_01